MSSTVEAGAGVTKLDTSRIEPACPPVDFARLPSLGTPLGPLRAPKTAPTRAPIRSRSSASLFLVERGAPTRSATSPDAPGRRDFERAGRGRQVTVMKKTSASKSTVKSTTSAATATGTLAKQAAAPPVEIGNLPSVTAPEVQTFVDAIDNFAQLLGASFVVPQPDDVRRMPKARKEAPTIVPMVADLSTRYGVTSAAYPSTVTLAKQQIVNTLSPVAERIAAVQKLVASIITVGQSGAWEGSMVTYGLLKSESRGNAVLRNALTPVREKLRPTYETEDGGKTKVRSRSKKSVTAKDATEATSAPAPSAQGTQQPAASAPAPVAQTAAAAPEVAASDTAKA
jgi:hypothetical protein